MSAELIEQAILRLENARPRIPWTQHGSIPSIVWMGHPLGGETKVLSVGSERDAAIIVMLMRTIDAQLGILREGLSQHKDHPVRVSAILLAEAITA